MTTAALEADFAAYKAEEDSLGKANHLRTQFIGERSVNLSFTHKSVD
jgi:hypothetical protein